MPMTLHWPLPPETQLSARAWLGWKVCQDDGAPGTQTAHHRSGAWGPLQCQAPKYLLECRASSASVERGSRRPNAGGVRSGLASEEAVQAVLTIQPHAFGEQP